MRLLALPALFVAAVLLTAFSQDWPGSRTRPTLAIVWEGALPEARAAHQATLLHSGKVLITGGCRESGCEHVLASAVLYDPATRAFAPTTPMGSPRVGHAAVTLGDGRVLVTGGWTGNDATPSAEIFDPESGVFLDVGTMHESRESPSAILLDDGRVLIMGGSTAEVFDPAVARFTYVAEHRRIAPALVKLPDGRVLATGGDRRRHEVLATAAVFDPVANTFTPTGRMTVPRHKHGAVLLHDGRVLVVGGSDRRDFGGLYASTEVYDPVTETFTAGPTLQVARHKLQDAVATLPSGAVLIAGGAPRPEVWHPGDEAFAPIQGELSGWQMFATATVMSTGEVLVVGGYDRRIRPAAQAWVIGRAMN